MKFGVWSLLLSLFLSLAVGSLAQAAGWDDLTTEQQSSIQAGEFVFITQPVDGAPWPQARFYKKVKATPEESAAVFADYELQSSYLPGMLSAKISRQLDAVTAQIEYVIHVPILKNERNTLQDHLAMAGPGSYRIDWKLLSGTYTRSVVGAVSFEALGSETLMSYTNLIAPSTGFPGMQKIALNQVRDGALALAGQIEKEHQANDPAVLQHQVAALRQALGHLSVGN